MIVLIFVWELRNYLLTIWNTMCRYALLSMYKSTVLFNFTLQLSSDHSFIFINISSLHQTLNLIINRIQYSLESTYISFRKNIFVNININILMINVNIDWQFLQFNTFIVSILSKVILNEQLTFHSTKMTYLFVNVSDFQLCNIVPQNHRCRCHTI